MCGREPKGRAYDYKEKHVCIGAVDTKCFILATTVRPKFKGSVGSVLSKKTEEIS